MYKNLKRFRKQLEKEGKMEEASKYNFFPQTYNMPAEYAIFLEEYKKSQNNLWIMKPVNYNINKVGKAQGRGIFLITNLNQISQWKNAIKTLDGQGPELYVAQKYVMNPLLIGGKKFDLRIYALVTNYSPLTVYLYRTGFARFTHCKFSTNLEDVGNNYIHLTNVAIQKNSDNYDEKTGGKWDLRSLKLYLMSKYKMVVIKIWC